MASFQLDWVQAQAKRLRQLESLREIIAKELRQKFPHSAAVINVTLMMIRQSHGEEAEQETRLLFGLDNQVAA